MSYQPCMNYPVISNYTISNFIYNWCNGIVICVVLHWWTSVIKHSKPTYYIVQLLLTKFYERFKLEHISTDSIANPRGKDVRFWHEVISWIRSRAPISNQSAVDALFIADPPSLLLCACICLEMALVIIVTHCLPKLLPSGLNLAFYFEYLISHQTLFLQARKMKPYLRI